MTVLFLCMINKEFIGDKNYLAYRAQSLSRQNLLLFWINCVLDSHSILHNPLGLTDGFMIRLRSIQPDVEFLSQAYDLLAAFYRFKYTDNQLAFIWDGTSHVRLYREEWRDWFERYVQKMSLTEPFNRIVLKGTLVSREENREFLEKSLIRILSQDLQIKKNRKGYIEAA